MCVCVCASVCPSVYPSPPWSIVARTVAPAPASATASQTVRGPSRPPRTILGSSRSSRASPDHATPCDCPRQQNYQQHHHCRRRCPQRQWRRAPNTGPTSLRQPVSPPSGPRQPRTLCARTAHGVVVVAVVVVVVVGVLASWSWSVLQPLLRSWWRSRANAAARRRRHRHRPQERPFWWKQPAPPWCTPRQRTRCR